MMTLDKWVIKEPEGKGKPLPRNTHSLLKYFGGKYRFLPYLLPFPYHKMYVEVFGGSGVVLLNKFPVRVEIYNDVNNELVNFWEVFKTQKDKLIEGSQYILNSSDIFLRYRKEKVDGKIERAVRFFYLNRHSFSALFYGYYGITTGTDPHHTFLSLLENNKFLTAIWDRIKYVKFECQDFRQLIPKVDKKGALIYLDPPYFKGGETYAKMPGGQKWGETDFRDLKVVLEGIEKALFILSIDDNDYFSHPGWYSQKIDRINVANNKFGDGGVKPEYIIRNFKSTDVRLMKDIRTKAIMEYG